MINVGQHLIVGIGMDSGHQAIEHTDRVMQGFDEGGQAVGGTRRVRDDGVGGLQHLMVDAIDHRRVNVLAARCGNHDLARATLQMEARLFLAREKTGALEHHIDTEVSPGQGRGITIGKHADPITIDDNRIAIDRDRTGKAAMRGIKSGQVGIGLCIAEVVDRNDLDRMPLATLVVGSQDVAADPAITIDGNAQGHRETPEEGGY